MPITKNKEPKQRPIILLGDDLSLRYLVAIFSRQNELGRDANSDNIMYEMLLSTQPNSAAISEFIKEKKLPITLIAVNPKDIEKILKNDDFRKLLENNPQQFEFVLPLSAEFPKDLKSIDCQMTNINFDQFGKKKELNMRQIPSKNPQPSSHKQILRVNQTNQTSAL
jgi:hypothetical protein